MLLPFAYHPEFLPWDSDFLGYPVASITIAAPNDDLELVAAAVEEAPFRLVYCFADEADFAPARVKASIANAVRVDGRVRYVRTPLTAQATHPGVSMASLISPQLLKIAVQAGRFSRFFTDEHFDPGTGERLYRIWIERSVSGEIADHVLQFTNTDGEQLGFLTIAEKNNYLDLGLLCVDGNARGQGIASALLQYAENFAFSKGYEGLQLVTQEKNLPARSLFEKFGFKQVSVTGIFHVWKQEYK